MGFVKDIAKVGALGLSPFAALAFGKKKKTTVPPSQPSMISISPTSASMIGSTRGGY